MVFRLQQMKALGQNSLILITYDETGDETNSSGCGLSKKSGDPLAILLITRFAHEAFMDATAYSHDALHETIGAAGTLTCRWQTADDTTNFIAAS